MKNLVLIFTILFGFNSLVSATNIGDGDKKLVEAEKVTVSVDLNFDTDFIISSVYNTEKENLEFMFENEVSMIQVMNENGDIEMMLPIMGKDVSLGLSLFEKGSYKMGFMVEGETEVQVTDLVVR